MNPYDFVPFGKRAPRRPVTAHEKYSGNFGKLTCRIKTLTPLFVGAMQERPQDRHEHQRLSFQRDGDRPSIPGSSLKGSFRSVAEALSGSCLVLPGNARMRSPKHDKLSYWDKGKAWNYPLPEGFSPCGMDPKYKHREACPACRVFGYLSPDQVHLGHINFSAAKPVGNYQFQWLTLEPSGKPSPRHRPFYGTQESQFEAPRGRKFYYHRIDGARTTTRKTGQNKTVEAIMPEAEFEFSLEYQNLHDDELALLVFSLILEEPMCHKIGMGKGLGLGSVQIAIHEWQKIDMSQRYKILGSGAETLSGEALESVLNEQRQKYHEKFGDWRACFEKLRDIWTWDESRPRDTRYPSYFWFKDFARVPLEEVPDDAGVYKVRAQSAQQLPMSEGRKQKPAVVDKNVEKTLKQVHRQVKALQKQAERTAEMLYQDREVEKAKIVRVAENTFDVVLKKLVDKEFTVKKKNRWRPYNADQRIRVRILVNAKGEVTRVEEV